LCVNCLRRLDNLTKGWRKSLGLEVHHILEVRLVTNKFGMGKSLIDQIPPEMARRFNYDGNMPKNWGEAVEFRILNQNSNFRNNAVYGTQIEPKAN
jgi:hypothetical protein